MDTGYGTNLRHREIIEAFNTKSLRVEFDSDGDPMIFGTTGKSRELPILASGYKRTDVPYSSGVRSNGTAKRSRRENVHVIVYLWDSRKEYDTSLYQIHHKDGNKENNRLSNLELVRLGEHGKLGQQFNQLRISSIDLIETEHKYLIDMILTKAPIPSARAITILFNLRSTLAEKIVKNFRKGIHLINNS
jgi:HNH endonuclease